MVTLPSVWCGWDCSAVHGNSVLHHLKLLEIVIDVVWIWASQISPRQSPRHGEGTTDHVLPQEAVWMQPPLLEVRRAGWHRGSPFTQPPVPRWMGFSCPSTKDWVLCSRCCDVGLLGIALEPTRCRQCLCSLCKGPVFAWRKVLSCSRVELTHNQGDPQDLGA